MEKNLLRLLRGSKSQKEMADKYRVTQQGWSKWENGDTVPDNQVMLTMEREYKIPMEVIFFEAFNYKMK